MICQQCFESEAIPNFNLCKECTESNENEKNIADNYDVDLENECF